MSGVCACDGVLVVRFDNLLINVKCTYTLPYIRIYSSISPPLSVWSRLRNELAVNDHRHTASAAVCAIYYSIQKRAHIDNTGAYSHEDIHDLDSSNMLYAQNVVRPIAPTWIAPQLTTYQAVCWMNVCHRSEPINGDDARSARSSKAGFASSDIVSCCEAFGTVFAKWLIGFLCVRKCMVWRVPLESGCGQDAHNIDQTLN